VRGGTHRCASAHVRIWLHGLFCAYAVFRGDTVEGEQGDREVIKRVAQEKVISREDARGVNPLPALFAEHNEIFK